MPPTLVVALADLEYDDAALIDRFRNAIPPGRVTVLPSRPEPDHRRLAEVAVDLGPIDTGVEKVRKRGYARYLKATVGFADRTRPMLMVHAVEFPVEDLHDAPPADASLFAGGWACLDRMDERRAGSFRRALAGTGQAATPHGVAWSGASAEICERLRLAWTSDPPPRPG